MKVSVVICTVDHSTSLRKMLDSLLHNSVLPSEVIVVHQGNGSEAMKIVSQFDKFKHIIRYFQHDGYGASRARNFGSRKAEGEIIAFTDDDAYVGTGWIENIIGIFEQNKNVGIVGGKIIPIYNEINKNWEIPPTLSYVLPFYDQGEIIAEYPRDATPPTVNFSIRKDLLIRLGGFNEKLDCNLQKKVPIFGADTDMAVRVKNAGYQLIYSPKCVVYHPVPLSRQNLGFLKKRMFIEGNTDTCLYFLHNKPTYRYKLNMLKYRFLELMRHIKSKKQIKNKNLYEGKKSRIMGYLYGIIVYGLVFPNEIR